MRESDLFKTVPKRKILSFIYDENNEVNVRELMGFLHLEKSEIAALCGIKQESVRFDERMPVDVRNLFIEIANMCELVGQYFEGDPVKTETWFKVVNPKLNNQSPVHLIKAGKCKDITDLLLSEI